MRGLLVLVTVLSLAVAGAQGMSVEAITESVESEPGKPVTLRIAVENDSESPRTLAISHELPTGWRPLLPPSPVSLEPNEAKVLLLPVVMPRSAAAGSYLFSTKLQGEGGSWDVSHEVVVPEVHDLSASLISAPELAIAEPYELVFAVANQGNVPEPIVVEVRDNLGFPLRVEGDETAVLSPQRTMQIRVVVTPPSDLEKPAKHSVAVRVRGEPGGVVKAFAYGSVEVAAMRQPESLAYRTFDLRVDTTLRLDSQGPGVAGVSGLDGLDLEVKGSGPLREDGEGELSLSLSAGVGNGDRNNHLSYRRPEFRLDVGDQRLAGSPLLPSASGFGVLAATPGAKGALSHAHAFALVGEDGVVGGLDGAVAWDNGLELSGQARMGAGAQVAVLGVQKDTELGVGDQLSLVAQQGLDLGTLAPAFNLEARYDGDQLTASADWRYFASGYDGRTSGAGGFGAAFSLRANPEAQVEARASYRQFSSPEGNSYLGATAELTGSRFDSDWSVRYLYYHSEGEDHSDLRQDVTFRARLRLDHGLLVHSRAWWQKEEDISTGESGEALGAALDFSVSLPRGTLRPNALVEYDLYGQRIDHLDLGLGWKGSLSSSTDMELKGSVGLLGSETVEMMAGAQHEFDSGTRIEAETELLFEQGTFDRFQAQFGLSIPVRLNLGTRSDVARVTGSVKDGSGSGVEGAVVWLAGYTTVTSADGSFTFPAIPPGRHAVAIRGVKPGLVVTPALPHSIAVEAGASESLTMTVRRSSAIAVAVRVADEPVQMASRLGGFSGNGEGADSASLLSGLRMVLEGPSGTRQAIVRDDGSARFTHLVPGTWRVRVASESVPEHYRVEPAQVTIELSEGSSEVPTFELVPVTRKIVFTGGGTLGN